MPTSLRSRLTRQRALRQAPSKGLPWTANVGQPGAVLVIASERHKVTQSRVHHLITRFGREVT